MRAFRLCLPAYWLQLVVALWRWQPDIIWVQSNEERLAVAPVASLMGISVVWTLHGPVDTSGSQWYQRRFKAAGAMVREVICVSNHVKVAAVAAGVPRERCRVITNGVTVPATVSAEPSQPVVAFIGRLEIEKGPDIFVAAALRVLADHSDYQFLVAGDGQLMGALRHQAAPAGAAIRFLGWTNVAEVLTQCQVVAAPSRAEAQGLAVLEAMAAGRPVVTASVGGLAEMIHSGHNGVLVPPDDSEALATAVSALLADKDMRQQLGKAGRAYVQQHHGARKWVERTLSVLETAH
jgi:glycosyltransferase involved in cell wall biosynthesis